MAAGLVLEMATLAERHPKVKLLELFGAQLVYRLRDDPVSLPVTTFVKPITVDWLTPSTRRRQVEEIWQIGWQGLANLGEEDCVRMSRTLNEHRITEDAAIGVMALLIHELERMEILEVLPIGSGGDYLIRRGKSRRKIQVEVSGLRVDSTGAQARSRLQEKCTQVLTHSTAGYASVTTFHRAGTGEVHSFLHYVEKPKKGPGNTKAYKRGRKKQ